jgi:serine/threonine protein kinase
VKTALDNVYREINILKNLNHENIIKIFEVIHDDDHGKIYIVMENCNKGSLMSWDTKENKFVIKWTEGRVSEEVLRHIFRQIVYGVYYLHMQLIVHFDLKPQNILLTDDLSVKISDFDRAFNLVTSDFLLKNPGTYQFFPPESISSASYNSSYRCKAVDMWSLGLILYTLVYNVLPFNGQNMAELFKSIEEFQ